MNGKYLFDHWLRIVALIIALVGLVLTIDGFIQDPAGQIHHSVLIYFGEGLIFVGVTPIIEFYTRTRDKDK